MRKLAILPDGPSYSVEDGNEVIRTAVEGGAALYRRDFIGATSMVSTTYTCMPNDYHYLRAFYNTATEKSSLPFLADLIMDQVDDYTEHTCHFIPGSMKLVGNTGLQYTVSVTMEVEPIEANTVNDNSFMDAYEAYGGDLNRMLARISYFANTTMPNTIGTIT